MSLSKSLIKFLCIPFLCALILTAVASSATFASATRPTTPQASCPTLQKGSTDSDSQGKVSVLQQKLKDNKEDLGNYGKKKDGVDGIFGDKTEAAVKKFQGDNHLKKSDGIVGDETWKALKGCDGSTSGSNGSQTSSKTARIDSCKAGIACGSASFTFTGKNQLTNISMNVKDIVCDGQNPYIELVVYYSNTSTIAKKVVGNNGCHGAPDVLPSDQSTYKTPKGENIDKVHVVACTTLKRKSNTPGYTDTRPDPCVPDNYKDPKNPKNIESKYVKNPNL